MERLTRWNGKKFILPQGHGMWRLIADTPAKYEEEEEKGLLLHLPCAIGTPVIKIEFNQHDGYWLEAKFFNINDLYAVGDTVFLTKDEAVKKLSELERDSPLIQQMRKKGLI